ncbi:hypothetical protein M3Y98_01144000 [Aphelenchoides besseyi]|nr:hypothetical protein M3Y98_01144000 [Aphelenchoides besseyi]KAI6210711.1 hypothetical protein M3Y96_00356900 [Aphelenchoides besseyi]
MKGDGKRRFVSKEAAAAAKAEHVGYRDESQNPSKIRRSLPSEEQIPEELKRLLGEQISDRLIHSVNTLAYNMDVGYTDRLSYMELCKRIYCLGFLTLAQSYLEQKFIGNGYLAFKPGIEHDKNGECVVSMTTTAVSFKELTIGFPLKVEHEDGTSICTVYMRRSIDKKHGEFNFSCNANQDKLAEYKDKMFKFYEFPGTFMGRSIIRTAEDLARKRLYDLVFPRSLDRNDCSAQYYCQMALGLMKKMGTYEDLNVEQRLAVFAIVNRCHSDRPFCLFGPPGTGKTVTIVAAAVRLLKQNPKHRLLMCAPSGVAADRLALKLLEARVLQTDQILRLCSLSKDASLRDTKLDSIVLLAGNDRNYMLPDEYDSYRVVISTIACTTHIINAGVLDTHFSHVFIDEAGQASEAEFWIPIAGLCTPQTAVILSGDAKQLGPVVGMDLFSYGLAFSSPFLRFVNHPAYLDERLCVLLRDSYRSHHAIIDFSSKIFYHGAVRSAECVRNKMNLGDWCYLLNKEFPVIFIDAVDGKELPRKTSYSNDVEARIITFLVKNLIENKHASPDEIAVITPYRGQTENLFETMDKLDVIVDSVERYQGSERRIIFVSLTRTNDLGFVRSRRRMNTSLTRAKELMVVVGKRSLLYGNSYWREFIRYCEENRSFYVYVNERLQPCGQ